MNHPPRHVLLTGASGYVGGRLLHLLEARKDIKVRCLARRPENVHPLDQSNVEIIEGDLIKLESLESALKGIEIAYFMVHALGSKNAFDKVERKSAENFALAARNAGVRRIIYLGGLGSGEDLSPHLKTRHEVGKILRESGITTTEFRASIIIGSGSLSFELLRSLTEKLPIMITPRWLKSLSQPIAIEDVLEYLLAALDRESAQSEIFEIGGPDQVNYLGLIQEYAHQRKLRRYYIPVNVLSPYLSSLWLGLVTPVYARIGRKLIDSLRNDTVVTNNLALSNFTIKPMSFRKAISRALLNEDRSAAETRWYDSESAARGPQRWGGKRFGSRIIDHRTITIDVSAQKAFIPIVRIGGDRGWYYADWLWNLRGAMDIMLGGVGMRRGRPDKNNLRPGDPVDFWRVEAIIPNQLLRLRAEMKVPGRAWLQFEIKEENPNRCTIAQTAIFDPVGLWGLAYWYILYPLHALIFSGMLQGLSNAAKEL